MNRYALTWGSLGGLGLLALLAWWQAAEPSAPVLPSTAPFANADSVSPVSPAAQGLKAGGLGQVSGALVQDTDSARALPETEPVALAEAQHRGLLSPSFVAASLRALASNGVRLTQPQVSLHTVQTIDLPTAQALGRWARAQGFRVGPPIKVLEHGGEVNWLLPVERHGVLDVAQILADGQRISARASQTPGARYHTWQVPVDGRSTLAGGVAQS